KTAENIISKAKMEVDFDMAMNMLETLPWLDYYEVFEKLEERGRTEGEERGRAESQREIALNAFRNMDASPAVTAKFLQAAGVPEEIIREASEQAREDRSL
ncbi:MAG: hypothetical protein LBS10_07190, partial [Gracilibacteraceae bacterium]|nr:hypothetical protein [Gracilibacteraceae bacterium]